jgi:beta-N-acetylhexosaminidase
VTGRSRAALALAVPVLLLAACGGPGSGGSGDDPAAGGEADRTTAASPSTTGSSESSADPDTPLSWGPTAGELAQAEELVAAWPAEQLAGQVIVGRYDGTDPAVPAQLVADHHLAGVQVTSTGIADRDQVLATTAAVADAVRSDGRDFPPVLGIDQEGGVVSHLDGVATEFPSFATAGLAVANSPEEGPPIVREAAAATGLELRELGFSWVFAPVADVTIGAEDPTIGSRSPSTDPQVAARTVEAAVRGYADVGVVSTVKHFPGHGSATADSHETLPRIEAGLAQLRERDLIPFEDAVSAGAPAVMVGHLDVPALEEGVPSSLSPATYDFLRDDLDFEGVAITDSLGMGAVVATTKPAVTALEAGADLLLMPADTARTHATVTAAIESGELDRERVEEAAARVVAMQLWQQRRAAEVEVPPGVAERAQQAAAALSGAAY